MSWYYLDYNSEGQGPYSEQDFIEYYRQEIFNDDVLIWNEEEGWGDWKQFKDVEYMRNKALEMRQQQQDLTEQPDQEQSLEQQQDQTQYLDQQQDQTLYIDQQQDQNQEQLQDTKLQSNGNNVYDNINQDSEYLNNYNLNNNEGYNNESQKNDEQNNEIMDQQTDNKQQQLEQNINSLDPMQQFQQEITQIDQSAFQKEKQNEPEELEFEDDDGTKYVWDRYLKKYVVEQEPEQFPQPYEEQDMIFDPNEGEKIPTLEEAIKFEQDTEWKAEQLRVKNIKGETGQDLDNRNKIEAQQNNELNNQSNLGKRKSDNEAQDEQPKPKKLSKEEQKQLKKQKDKERKAQQQIQNQQWHDLKFNTSVYVTGLPSDVTVEEIVQEFQKCGFIKQDENNNYKIKIYRDKESGLVKGDGTISFIHEASLDLACTIMDGAPLRVGSQPMTVTPAKFEMHGDKYVAKEQESQNFRKKIKQKIEKQQRQLGWGGFDDKIDPKTVVVVLKHMFTIEDVQSDDNFVQDLEVDVKQECSKFGEIDNIKVNSGEPSGIITIKFKAPESAEKCLSIMQGRYFAGQQIEASMWDGFTKYKTKHQESEAEQLQRLEKFSEELEKG